MEVVHTFINSHTKSVGCIFRFSPFDNLNLLTQYQYVCFHLLHWVYIVYIVENVGVKMSTVSMNSIVSTQVAPETLNLSTRQIRIPIYRAFEDIKTPVYGVFYAPGGTRTRNLSLRRASLCPWGEEAISVERALICDFRPRVLCEGEGYQCMGIWIWAWAAGAIRWFWG